MSHAVSVSTISLAAAEKLADVALAHARAKGWKVAVVIADHAGVPVVVKRMDGVNAITGEIALDKAYTVAQLRRTTKALAERMTGSADLTMGMANRPRLMACRLSKMVPSLAASAFPALPDMRMRSVAK
jgi:uncharacterized protein GlcG (DUF336 family)